MSMTAARTEVVLREVVRHVEVTLREREGGAFAVCSGVAAGTLPWSALRSVPANLCVATVTDDEVSIEFRDLQGQLITRAPYLP